MQTEKETLICRNNHLVDFCSQCGAILPLPTGEYTSLVKCVNCGKSVSITVFDGISSSTTIVFNKHEDLIAKDKEINKGPIVERKCRKCPSEKMYYFTLQTRSADEGQTVFYTCTNCGAQENENS